MGNDELLSIAEFALKAGITKQAVYSQLNNRLKPFVQVVETRKMLEIRALREIYGIEVEQPIQPNLNNQLNNLFNPEVQFLQSQLETKDAQITALMGELAVEREHNREKDRQLLETLGKLAESQAALTAGQTADKQKALAETIISAQRPRRPALWARLFPRRYSNDERGIDQ